ncbi:hypothetical protein I4U23_028252 [Adineta vaga]|nr:hypothetical protein I4U23_028252 [Adineta vaga]
MFTILDNRRNSASNRQNLLATLIADCQQPNQPLLNQLIDYYFQTESPNALLLIKQFNEHGKEQTKILIEHLNNQGLKQCNRQSISLGNTDLHSHEEQERIAHTMKVFRILCLIIHSQVPGLALLIKDSVLLTNCLNAITKCKDDPNILAQGCYFFAALAATLPGEIIQQTDAIVNIFKATCKYLYKNLASLRQLSLQIYSHSLEKVQLWIVNQSAHALFYTLYTAYPCNFIYQIQREFLRNENPDVFENIFIPMFQRVRLNSRLIESDRKRESDKDKRLRNDIYNIIYEARKLSLDPLFGRELPMNVNWMHQEMKRILPFQHFKRQSPARSTDQLYDGLRSMIDNVTPPEIISKRSSSSPFQKFKDKIKSFVRPTSASTPATTISTPDVGIAATTTANTTNTLSIPNVSSGILTSPSPSLGSDIRAVKTMPELQSNTDLTSSATSTPTIRRSHQEHHIYVETVINTISTIYDQNIPSDWRKILGRFDSNLLIVSTPQRYATFYVSPSEHSLDNQQQQHHQQYDDSSPTSTNEKRQRCASASCASGHHVHSPVLAAPITTTSTDDILPRTRSLSIKQRTRNSATGPFYQKHHLTHQTEYDEDDNDDNVLINQRSSMDSWAMPIPTELYINSETKNSIVDELSWNDHDLISIPHFDFNDIVTNNCSSKELKQFDRLYECHSSYEIFLTDQYRKIWEYLWAKEKSYKRHLNDLHTAYAFTSTLRDEVAIYLPDELNMCNHESKCISDENTLLGGKVVELGKVTFRRKQMSANDEKNNEICVLEENCEQLRKIVNNETLKLSNLQNELDDNEKETKVHGERLEQLKLLTKNITYLDELNQQLECQYLRFTDDMSVSTHNHSLSSQFTKDDDEQQHQQPPFKSTSSTTINGHDETSEIDSISFNEEHREEIDDLHQQDEIQIENYDQLLVDIIETLKHQNQEMNVDQSIEDVENQAYAILLEYMESKSNMQNYLVEHNTRYIDLYLEVQQDYIAQAEKNLNLNQSILEQMQNVAI